jgi:WD40 repeat protein
LYALLTGRPPFTGETPLEVLERVKGQAPEPPSRANRHVPRDLETVCLKCLDKEPSRRYRSAEAVAEDLERWLTGEPIQARPVGRLERAYRWGRRNAAVAALIGVVVLAVLLGSAAATVYAIQATRAGDRAARGERDARRHLYLAKMQVAESAWRDARVGRVVQVLEETRPEGGEDFRGFEWHYLWSTCHSALTLRGQADAAIGLAFSPDGSRLASVGQQGGLMVWDVRTGKEMLTRAGHTTTSCSLAFLPDGLRVASGGPDGAVRVWDATANREVRSWKAFRRASGTNSLPRVALSPDGRFLASAGQFGTGTLVKVWDVGTGREVFTCPGPWPSGEEFRAWDVGTGTEVVASLGGGASRDILNMAFSPDGRCLALGLQSGEVQVWDAAIGREAFRRKGHTKSILSLAFSPDGKLLASAGADGMAKVWEAATGREKQAFHGHTSWINHVTFAPHITLSPDGKLLASAGYRDRTAKVWNVATGQEILTLRGSSAGVNTVVFSPDGLHLAGGGLDGTVEVWDIATGQEARTVVQEDGQFLVANRVAYDPDGERLAGVHNDGALKVWDARTGREVHSVKIPQAHFRNVAYFPGGQRLAIAENHGVVRVWDAIRWQELLSIPGRAKTILGLTVSPDGQHLAIVDNDGTVRVWDVAGARETLTLPGNGRQMWCPAFSPDGLHLAGGGDGAVTVWEVATGSEIRSLPVGPDPILRVCYSPDGRHLAAAGRDGAVRVWDVASSQEVLTRQGHGSPPNCLVYSSDSRRLVSGDRYGVTVRDAETGLELLTLRGHDGSVTLVGFSRDGRHLLSCAGDGSAKVWNPAPLTNELRKEWEGARHNRSVVKEARLLVGSLFGRPLLKADVLARLRQDDSLAEDVRRQAVALAERVRDFPWVFNFASWAVVKQSGRPAEEYHEAMHNAEIACRLESQNGDFWNTLGVARYRVGDWKAALKALEKAMELRQGGDSADWFFLAMAHWQLGDKDQARRWYDKAVAWMEKHQPKNEELRRFRAEAAELIGLPHGPPTEKKDLETAK